MTQSVQRYGSDGPLARNPTATIDPYRLAAVDQRASVRMPSPRSTARLMTITSRRLALTRCWALSAPDADDAIAGDSCGQRHRVLDAVDNQAERRVVATPPSAPSWVTTKTGKPGDLTMGYAS